MSKEKQYGIDCCIDCDGETDDVCDNCGMLCCCGDYRSDEEGLDLYLCVNCQQEYDDEYLKNNAE